MTATNTNTTPPNWIMDAPVDARRFVFETDATRYDVTVVPDTGSLLVMLPDFGRAARIGYGCEKHYLAEKLNISTVDAANIIWYALSRVRRPQ